MAMSAVIFSAVTYFMFSGSNNYQYNQTNVTLQAEAQIMMNQITERAYRFGNAEVFEVGGDDAYIRLFLADADGNPIVDSSGVVAGGNTFWLDKVESKLYVYEDYIPDADLASLDKDVGFLGDNVTDLAAEVTAYGTYRALEVVLTLEKGSREYETSNLIRFRNQ